MSKRTDILRLNYIIGLQFAASACVADNMTSKLLKETFLEDYKSNFLL